MMDHSNMERSNMELETLNIKHSKTTLSQIPETATE